MFVPITAVLPSSLFPLPLYRYDCRRYRHYRGKIFRFVPTTAVLPLYPLPCSSLESTKHGEGVCNRDLSGIDALTVFCDRETKSCLPVKNKIHATMKFVHNRSGQAEKQERSLNAMKYTTTESQKVYGRPNS